VTILRGEQDAFGAALLAHMDGTMADRVLLLEVDDGRIMPAMPPSEFFKGPDEWPPWEHVVLHDIDGPILDLGCGAGRHALLLQAHGQSVVGIDNSPGAIEVCRRRGVRDVRLADLLSPPDDQRWGPVLLMCGNVGLDGGWDETSRLLVRLHELCRPGALLVADSVDPTQNDDPQSVAYREGKRASGRHEGEVRLRLRFGERVTPFWNLLNLAPSDVERLIARTGWHLETHIIDGTDHAIRLRRR
jgi:SAM-dependent methyltransferase